MAFCHTNRISPSATNLWFGGFFHEPFAIRDPNSQSTLSIRDLFWLLAGLWRTELNALKTDSNFSFGPMIFVGNQLIWANYNDLSGRFINPLLRWFSHTNALNSGFGIGILIWNATNKHMCFSPLLSGFLRWTDRLFVRIMIRSDVQLG